jgi:hypothetical protein
LQPLLPHLKYFLRSLRHVSGSGEDEGERADRLGHHVQRDLVAGVSDALPAKNRVRILTKFGLCLTLHTLYICRMMDVGFSQQCLYHIHSQVESCKKRDFLYIFIYRKPTSPSHKSKQFLKDFATIYKIPEQLKVKFL